MKRNIILNIALALLLQSAICLGQSAVPGSMQNGSVGSSKQIRDMILDPEPHSGWLLGIFGGMDYNMHHGGFATTEGSIICCVASDGTGTGAALGAKAFIPLSDEISLTPRIIYEGRNGTFSASPETYPILGQNNTQENVILTKQFKASIATVGADLFLAWKITDNGLYLAGGPSVATIVSKHFIQSEHVESPSGVTYLGGSPDATVLDSDLDITKSVQVLIKLGIGYQIQVSDHFTLNPEALYGIPLTKFSKTYDWAGSALQFTLGILYSI
ncbi:MAG: outer membrane beta-barrel protein [Bacteroidota bacterium]|nr:outer membrane beta-barrel protein [Bacteroidota bacterium]MDP4228880.1 outer membrane beta-barrel protein [Bacteroidota bacterium]MDP4234955.1 outer membrane beta-barrel protein [Bacteroidota bacterium]